MKINWKKLVMFIFIVAIIITIIPVALDIFIFGNTIPSNISNETWAGFFGSYVGAIIGAVVTLVGIVITINFTKNENEKIRRDSQIREEMAFEKEIHIMVADMDFLITDCGEKLLDDINSSKDWKNEKFPGFYEAEAKMLKEAKRLLAYTSIRATVTEKEQLKFAEAFEVIAAYANKCVDICEELQNVSNESLCEYKREKHQDEISMRLIVARAEVEKALHKYSIQICK